MKQQSLKSNFSWTLTGNILYAFSQWYIVFVLAKFGSPELVGIYSLGLAISAPILMLTGLQLRTVQATDPTNAYSFGNYLSLRIIMTSLSMILILVLMFFLNYSDQKYIVILLISLSRAIDTLSDIVFGLIQKHERMDLISKSRIINSLLTIMMFTVSIIYFKSLIIGSLFLLLISIFNFCVIDLRNARKFEHIRPDFNISNHKKIIIVSLPLGIVLMLASLNTNAPRYLIEYFLNSKELGFFTAIFFFIAGGQTVITALTQSVAPRLAKIYYFKEFRKFSGLLIKLTVISIIFSVTALLITVLFGEQILTLFYTEEYSKYHTLFILLMSSTLFLYPGAFIGCGLTASRKFKIQPYIEAVTLLFTIVTSILLIPKLGLNGSAIVVLIGSTIQFLLKALIMFHILKKDIKKGVEV